MAWIRNIKWIHWLCFLLSTFIFIPPPIYIYIYIYIYIWEKKEHTYIYIYIYVCVCVCVCVCISLFLENIFIFKNWQLTNNTKHNTLNHIKTIAIRKLLIPNTPKKAFFTPKHQNKEESVAITTRWKDRLKSITAIFSTRLFSSFNWKPNQQNHHYP